MKVAVSSVKHGSGPMTVRTVVASPGEASVGSRCVPPGVHDDPTPARGSGLSLTQEEAAVLAGVAPGVVRPAHGDRNEGQGLGSAEEKQRAQRPLRDGPLFSAGPHKARSIDDNSGAVLVGLCQNAASAVSRKMMNVTLAGRTALKKRREAEKFQLSSHATLLSSSEGQQPAACPLPQPSNSAWAKNGKMQDTTPSG